MRVTQKNHKFFLYEVSSYIYWSQDGSKNRENGKGKRILSAKGKEEDLIVQEKKGDLDSQTPLNVPLTIYFSDCQQSTQPPKLESEWSLGLCDIYS